MKRIRIISAFLLILFIACSCFACTYAYTSESDEQAKAGTSLDNGYSMIVFSNYTLYGTGKYFEYKFIYDYSYYQKKKSVLTNLLADLESSFKSNGYNVSVNNYTGELIAYIKFDTTEDYLKATDYSGFDVEDDEYDSVVKTGFYTDYSYKMKTIFEDVDKDYKYIGRLYSIGCVKAGINKEDVILKYVFGTPYKQSAIRSSADQVLYSAGDKLYLHIFNMTFDTKDREIEITQHVPNTPVWYAVALAAGVVVFTVPFAIYMSKRKKKE